MSDMTDLHDRLRLVCAGASYARIGRLTGTHPETVRRYMAGDAPSAPFVTALCRATRLSADWLLCRRGRPLSAAPTAAAPPAEDDIAAIRATIAGWPSGKSLAEQASAAVAMKRATPVPGPLSGSS